MCRGFAVLTVAALVAGLFLSPAAPRAAAQSDFKQRVVINGVGASFPYPLYAQWAHKYEALTGMKLNYQSIGSGGGIAQIKAKTVDFGASDAPLKAVELDESGLIQFPMVIGGVVPILNVSGVSAGQLKLSPKVLTDIFLGNVAKWDDAAIKALNPDVSLPSLDITVVHRADGSGTTWIFTNYLAAVSAEWKDKVGADKAVDWPVVGVGAKGNEGVANYVQRLNGSVGYVEYAYAVQNQLTYAKLQNRAGNFVDPTAKTFQAAAANADWENAPGYYVVLVDQPGADSWPITGASFILIYKQQANGAQAKHMLDFFDWCFKHGADMAEELDYVPIPPNVVELVESTWTTQVKAGGAQVWK